MLAALGLLLACTPEPPDTLLVLDREAGYAPTAVPAGRLADPYRLDGDLVHGYRGGRLRASGYDPGGALAVDFELVDGVAVPLDLDGLVLWSFHAHLEQAVDELAALGHDLSPLFPVQVAWAPASVLDFKATENAAWASGMDLFVLFPDALTDGVPLAANEGVVRHELGHAWMEVLATGGDGTVRGPWYDEDGAVDYVSLAVGEGFADTVATLGLGEADFLAPSIEIAGRNVDGDAEAPASDPAGDTLDALLGGEDAPDPYVLGNVYASYAWDLGLVAGREQALAWVVEALDAWIAAEAWADREAYPRLLCQAAATEVPEAACDAFTARFPTMDAAACCP